MRVERIAVTIFLLFGISFLRADTDPGYFGLSPRDRQTVGLELPGMQINTYNGNLSVTVPIFQMPGRGLPIECYLVHNTDHRAVTSSFGRGWNFSYHIRYLRHGNGDVTVAWGSGRQDRFTANPRSGGGFTSPNDLFMTLTEPVPGQLTLRDKRGVTFHFDDATHRKLTSISDPNGNLISLGYNVSGTLQTVTDASGRVIRLIYRGGLLLRRLVDESLNRTHAFTYDGLNRLTGITDPMGQMTQYQYDGEHLLTGVTDKRGNTAAISYTTPAHHAGTRLPATIVKDVSTTGFDYDMAGRMTTVNDARGNDWRYDYDPSGRAVGLRNPNLQSIVLGWDGANNLTSFTDRNGHTHGYTYDALGNLLSHTDALGQMRSWIYNPVFCRRTSYTDRNGNNWSFQYDGNGNMTGITDPLTNQTTITYDGFGQPDSSIDPALEITDYGYDANGNMTSITDPLGGVRTHLYDSAGREIQVTDANDNATTRVYDALDRITSSANALGQTTAYGYDAENNLTMLTDPRGGTTGYTHDPLGRLTQVLDALGNTETYVYDAMGNRTSITDRRGNTTSFLYDSLGWLTRRTTPLGDIWRYGYDLERNMVTRQDPLGQIIAFDYDDNDRLTSRTLPGPFVTSYVYDANGNLTSASQPGSTLTFTYDALNRRTTQTDTGLGKTLTLTCDVNGNLENAIRPDGDTQVYEYDAHDRLTRITADGQQIDFMHDPGGRRTQVARPGPLTTDYTYDPINRLVVQETGDGVDTLSHTLVYSDDQLTETRESGVVHTMTFDLLDRMTRDVRSAGPAYDFNYEYDANGNLTDNSGTTPFFPNDPLAFNYNANNQVITESGTGFGGPYTRAYTYDDNGNLVQKLGAGTSTVTYTYDALNRLISATDSGVGTENYAYDALDRLQSIEVPAPAPGELGFQRFFYDQNENVIINYDMACVIQEQYWHNERGGTVLFSTIGGIDPIAPTPVSQAFTDSGLNDFNTFGADDFTVPDLGWEIETSNFRGHGGDLSKWNVNALALEVPEDVTRLIQILERERKYKPIRLPKSPRDGRLLGYPGFLRGKIVPIPPKRPPYGFPRLPDDYLLRKVGLTLFFLLQDPYGNNNVAVAAGLAGLVIQVYDLLKRIIVYGDPGPFGPGGNIFYRPRINATLTRTGLARDNYTGFSHNQPVDNFEIDRLSFGVGSNLGGTAGSYYFDEYESFR